MNKKHNENKNDKKGYYKLLLLTAISLFVNYVIIYLCFKGSGFIPAGDGLDKKDWLAFLGAYLSFSGTTLVSLIAIFQTYHYAKKHNKEQEADRKKQIQPIFSVDIVSVNEQVPGTAEVINPYQPDTRPKHENIVLKIENVGAYPIRHIIVFDKYLWQMLKPNEAKTFCVAYANSIDAQKYKNHIIEILETEIKPDENGIPKWFNINYEDVDGNEMYQTFKLRSFEDTNYYSLEGTYDV